jgi:hypothetical protein
MASLFHESPIYDFYHNKMRLIIYLKESLLFPEIISSEGLIKYNISMPCIGA